MTVCGRAAAWRKMLCVPAACAGHHRGEDESERGHTMDLRESGTDDALAACRNEVHASFENRALLYAHILDVLEEELGTSAAAQLMKRAIHRRGLEIGAKYREAAEAGDLAEVGRLFVEGSPCDGALFEPAVDEVPESGRTVLRMTRCPLVEAWREAGLSPERVDLLCDIAAAVDEGTFEGAGLDLVFLDRQACPGSERCLLELRLRNA